MFSFVVHLNKLIYTSFGSILSFGGMYSYKPLNWKRTALICSEDVYMNESSTRIAISLKLLYYSLIVSLIKKFQRLPYNFFSYSSAVVLDLYVKEIPVLQNGTSFVGCLNIYSFSNHRFLKIKKLRITFFFW